ncbi:hypothetical protein GNE10_04570 [Nostoc sp. 2RC]|nr:hypothetical protein [Nostoc sp. 2RC]
MSPVSLCIFQVYSQTIAVVNQGSVYYLIPLFQEINLTTYLERRFGIQKLLISRTRNWILAIFSSSQLPITNSQLRRSPINYQFL